MSAKDELNYEFSFFESEDSLAKYSTKKKKKSINTEKIIAVTLFLSIDKTAISVNSSLPKSFTSTVSLLFNITLILFAPSIT